MKKLIILVLILSCLFVHSVRASLTDGLPPANVYVVKNDTAGNYVTINGTNTSQVLETETNPVISINNAITNYVPINGKLVTNGTFDNYNGTVTPSHGNFTWEAWKTVATQISTFSSSWMAGIDIEGYSFISISNLTYIGRGVSYAYGEEAIRATAGSNYLNITNCTITECNGDFNNLNSIQIGDSYGAFVCYNNVTGNPAATGIGLFDMNDSVISHNIIDCQGNGQGIGNFGPNAPYQHLEKNVNITFNTVSNWGENPDQGFSMYWHGIYTFGTVNSYIYNNTLSDSYAACGGAMLIKSAYDNIYNNTFLGQATDWAFGPNPESADDSWWCTVTGTSFYNNTLSNYVVGGITINPLAGNLTIANNTFANCGTAIETDGSSTTHPQNITIAGNSITGGTYGIKLGYFASSDWYADSFKILNNNIKNQTVGVYLLAGSTNMSVQNNTFSSCSSPVTDSSSAGEAIYRFNVGLTGYRMLNVTAVESGSTVPSGPGWQYPTSTNETITATPNYGQNFTAWEVDGVNQTTTQSTWYVLMNNDHAAKAYFTSNHLNTISGTLKDKSNQAVQANIIVYQNGTTNVVSSTQTNSSGYYSLSVPNGTYDAQFNLTNFFIPGYSIKLSSINITNDTYNLIQSITGNQSANTVSIVLDVNNSQNIQIYSPNAPINIKKNSTYISSVSSFSQLSKNTWFYQSPNLYLMVSPEFIVNAASGSAADIQAAVNAVVASGGIGTVIIPNGTWYWKNQTVTIPAGVNIIGTGLAGCDGHPNYVNYTPQTILYDNVTNGRINDMFDVLGDKYSTSHPGYPTRISGIQFEEAPWTNLTGEWTDSAGDAITVNQINGFRIDHCTFIDFAGTSIGTGSANGWNISAIGYGVVDHCVFTLPYKINLGGGVAGYGVYTGGIYAPPGWGGPGESWAPWDPNVTDFFGKFIPPAGYAITYIEDCHFSYYRHCLDANMGGFYVARFDLMDNSLDTYSCGMADCHGTPDSVGGGGRGNEVYNNTFIAPPAGGWWEHIDVWALQLRGGSSLFYNNAYNCTNPDSHMVYLSLQDDASHDYPAQEVNNTYLWNNYYNGTLQTNSSSYYIQADSPLAENANYFLRAPDQAHDGFNYTPYPYPHPLTLAS